MGMIAMNRSCPKKFETRALLEGIDGTGFDQHVVHTIGEKIEMD
jgi:hypothetical protein